MRKTLSMTREEADELATWLEELKKRRYAEAKTTKKEAAGMPAIVGVIHALRSFSNGRD